MSSFRSFSPSHPLWRMRTHPIHPPTTRSPPPSSQPSAALRPRPRPGRGEGGRHGIPAFAVPSGPINEVLLNPPHRSCENSRLLGGSTLRSGRWLRLHKVHALKMQISARAWIRVRPVCPYHIGALSLLSPKWLCPEAAAEPAQWLSNVEPVPPWRMA